MMACLALVAVTLLAVTVGAIESPEWAVYRDNIKSMRVGGANQATTVGDALGDFLNYEFDLPLEFMRRAQVGVLLDGTTIRRGCSFPPSLGCPRNKYTHRDFVVVCSEITWA